MLCRCPSYSGPGLPSPQMSFVARVSRRRQNTGQADPGPEGGRKVYFFLSLSPPLASSFFPGAAPLAAAGAAPGAAFASPAAGAAPGADFTPSPGAPSTATVAS